MSSASARGTISLESARILSHQSFEAAQYVLRLECPRIAARARPGSFVHVRCAEHLPMRRPLSIMRADTHEGWIELLYKVVGSGTEALATRLPGESLSVLGPIGQGFEVHQERPRVLAIGGGVGIPPMVFLAEALQRSGGAWKPLVLMGSEVPFPFRTRPSRILVPGVPAPVIASMPLLDDLGVPSRLASGAGFAGCYEGYVTELADHWLAGLSDEARSEVEIFACGPTPMLRAVARVAEVRQVAAQVCLEEYMACAVGGCAGCAVAVHSAEGIAMKRVCVDGPVFTAASVFPPAGALASQS
jgi:dihydroorotate dehydrogenase electron transfer subunit